MRFGLSVLGLMSTAFLAMPVSGQIISQTPRPEVPDPQAQTIETIQHKERIGRSGTFIQIPRAGALLFAGFDADGDYIIDKAEVAEGIAKAYVRADKDNSKSLSLVELEAWRVAALGSEHAAPSNFAFAPNFARTVSAQTFTKVIMDLAERLDTDDQGNIDGKIAMSDLLKNFSPPRVRKNDNCIQAVREERRRVEQQCRSTRR
ncbi:MAG: hypothetical protein L3J65_06400 [Robiginitomaculum sp.]|nr:hypothetical protein [Robiginitomaculum sp.]